jgi:hypothetical protein
MERSGIGAIPCWLMDAHKPRRKAGVITHIVAILRSVG